MTRERRDEVVLVALVCSVLVHIGLMWAVKSHTMTESFASSGAERRAPIRLTRQTPQVDPAKLEEILDLEALKEAPAAEGDQSMPRLEDPAKVAEAAAALPELGEVQVAEPTIAPSDFAEKLAGAEPATPAPVLPLTRIETPVQTQIALPEPTFSVVMPAAQPQVPVAAPKLAGLPGEGAALPVARLATKVEKQFRFKPAEEIYEKVDEQVVAAEKTAVRELVNADNAADLVKFVNVTMTATVVDDWRYFRVMLVPRTSLPTVPKDVVLVIDGSGSIGNDRLGSCRAAARRILRSCTNTGDRFNLVVFRNAFSYAFRNWRACDAASFAAGDKWLNAQTAHGRTDVFSTIRSVLTLPRDPKRPLIALVVTDGEANEGVSSTAEILSKFTALNDGLVSVYMYGVKSSANRALIDVLTHGNRGESFVFEGSRWNAGEEMEALSARFRDPVLSDLRVIFASTVAAEAYPRRLRNLYGGGTLDFVGRVPASAKSVAFSLRGLGGENAYEGYFRLPFAMAPDDPKVVADWCAEQAIDRQLR